MVYQGSNNSRVLPYTKAASVKLVTLEFAGVKFKSKAITGLDYIKGVEQLLEKQVQNMPSVERIVICEEKYSFTPDSFKAATRDQREASTKPPSINHLKSGRKMLSSEKFVKGACTTSAEGKSLISTYVAQNMDKHVIKHNIIIDIDSELHMAGCECREKLANCKCSTYSIPVCCYYEEESGFWYAAKLEGIHQRKGEAEMSQIDWLVDSIPH